MLLEGQSQREPNSPVDKALVMAAFMMFALVGMGFEGAFATPCLSLIVFSLFLLYVFVAAPNQIIKYFYLYYLAVSNCVGVFVIETSTIQLYELGLISGFAGSFSLIVFFHMIVLAVLLVADSAKPRQYVVRTSKDKILPFALNICLGITAISFMLAITHPYYENGVDRFQYQNLGYVQFAVSKLVGWADLTFPVAIMGILNGHKKRALSILALASAAGFLTGNKFGLFLLLGSVVLLGFYPRISSFETRKMRKVFLVVALMLIALISLVFLHESLRHGMGWPAFTEYMQSRLAQQGQLWWRTYDLESTANTHLDEFGGEVASWFAITKSPESASYGIYKNMLYCVASPDLFYSKLANGSRYAFSTQATVYYYFGTGGLVAFAVAFALLYRWVVNVLIESMQNGSVLKGVVAVVFFARANSVYTQSDFDVLFSFNTLFYVALFVVASVYEYRILKRRDFYSAQIESCHCVCNHAVVDSSSPSNNRSPWSLASLKLV